MVSSLRDLSTIFDLVARDRALLLQSEGENNGNFVFRNRIFVTICFIAISILAVAFSALFSFMSVLIRILFQSLIIYRGFAIAFRLKVPYLQKIYYLLNLLGNVLKIPNLYLLFYPILSLYALLASININFSAINGTIIIFIIIIIIIISLSQ